MSRFNHNLFLNSWRKLRHLNNDPSKEEEDSDMTAIIEVDSLTKRYGSKRGIIDVSFQVEDGEVFGFLGPNGAGKTTTIRLLMALLRANAGSARIAGLDVWQQSVEIKRL